METEGDGGVCCCCCVVGAHHQGRGRERGGVVIVVGMRKRVRAMHCCCCVVGVHCHVIVAMWERMREREGEGHHRCQDGHVDSHCCVSLLCCGCRI